MAIQEARRKRERNKVDSRKFTGIYEVPRAAAYLLAARNSGELYPISSRQLIRWIRAGLTLPSLAGVPGRDLLISFEDLVSLRVIVALRGAGISWPKIRRAEGWLRQETGHTRPFATEQLWTERSEVFSEFRERLVAVSRHGQLAMRLVEDFLIPIHGLTFGRNRLAARWEPRDGIILDPQIQFGAPTIAGTRVPTRSILGMVKGGDSPEFVAQAYRVSPADVHHAIAWEEAAAA